MLININITQPGAESWHSSTLPRYLFSSFNLPGFLVSNTQSLTSIPIGHLAPSPFFLLSSFAPWQHLFPSFLSPPPFHKSFHRKKKRSERCSERHAERARWSSCLYPIKRVMRRARGRPTTHTQWECAGGSSSTEQREQQHLATFLYSITSGCCPHPFHIPLVLYPACLHSLTFFFKLISSQADFGKYFISFIYTRLHIINVKEW